MKGSRTENSRLEKTTPAQALALLEAFYPAADPAQLSKLASAAAGSTAVLALLEALLRHDRGKRFSEPKALLDALMRPPSADAQVFAGDDVASAQAAVARVLNNLGGLLQDALLLPSARQAYALALAYDEAGAGDEHWTVARDLNRLGTVLHDLGELSGAFAAYQRALAIDQSQLGTGHPAVARDSNNLALLLRDSGDPEQAYRVLQQALAIAEASLGAEHSYTQILHQNLSQLEQEFY